MKKPGNRFIFCYLLLFACSGCFFPYLNPNNLDNVEGYRPVYLSQQEIENVLIQGPAPMTNPGKIYIRPPYLFVNDQFAGIHIIDNSNPSKPVKIAFIKIPGNVDIAVKGNQLYADNGTDMLVLDISEPTAVKIGNRIKNAFPQQNFPPYRGYFECVNPSQGTVISWEKAQLHKPQCYR